MAGFAWVTLATNDSYSLGALVLAHSLRRVGSKHDLAVLVTPGVTGPMREKLGSVFSLVQEVNVLDSKDEANLALLARPELGITFTKLHCWRLTQYEKCVFIDADTLVIRNCDELFEREELSAAPDVGWPDCFNSGVFVFKPSQQTFASITAFAAAEGSFDGGDQGLLNQYFSDWAKKDISKHLPFIYNMCSTATYSYLPAFKQFGEDVRIIHFIGITKPWLQYFDTVTGQVQPAPGSNHLQPLLQLWWHIFCENVHSQLSPVMARSTLAPIRHEFNPFPSRSFLPSPHDANEFSYNNIQSTDPDFSEFQDPWDNYSSELTQANFSNPVDILSPNNYHRHTESSCSNDFLSNQNDDNCHRFRFPTSRSIVDCKYESQTNYSKNKIQREYENSTPSDDFQRITENNKQTHRDDCEIMIKNLEKHSHERHNDKSHCEVIHFSLTRDDNRGENYYNEGSYHESRYHEKNYCQEEINRHEDDHNRDEEYQSDERQILDHVRQEHSQDDHSLDKNHRQHDDHIHREENTQQHYHNYRDNHSHEKSNASNHNVLRNSIEMEIREIIAENYDEKWQIDENNMTIDRCNLDHSVRRTDVLTEISLSNPESEKTFKFPSMPCSKSKIIATQSEPNIAGQLESNDAGIAGALAKLTLGEARSPEQVAFEEHMRKQSWEQGQIDYMGRDSFDNIWKKISETLGVQPLQQPSPSKIVPTPEEIEVNDAAASVATEDEPAAKNSEPAASAEPLRDGKEDEDLIGELESRRIADESTVLAQSSGSNDAAVKPVELVTIDYRQLPTDETIESMRKKNDGEHSILGTITNTLDRSISEACDHLLRDIDFDKIEKMNLTEITATTAAAAIISERATMKSEKNIEPEDPKISESASSEIISESSVPIQVAESVLEPEVKESVTENLRPVTEEAISSISVSTGDIVSAALETTMQAICPSPPSSNDSAISNVISEIGNGIDAFDITSPVAIVSTDVDEICADKAEEPIFETEEIRPTIVDSTRQDVTSILAQESGSVPVAIAEEAKVSMETQLPVSVSDEIVEKAETPIAADRSDSSTVKLVKQSAKSELPARTEELIVSTMKTIVKSDEVNMETSRDAVDSDPSLIKSEESDLLSGTRTIGSITDRTDEKIERDELSVKSEKSNSPPAQESKAVKKINEQRAIPSALVTKSVETEVTADKVIESTASAPLKILSVESSTKTNESVAYPLKPKTENVEDPVEVQDKKKSLSGIAEPIVESVIGVASKTEGSMEKRDSKDNIKNTNITEALHPESSEDSPMRPARTKELQIPGTPTVTDATPPTSPPIGALESFDTQPTKTTKKIVKKVVKKITSGEPKSTEDKEVEGGVKKVTKKVVKKVVKKTKTDDAGSDAAAAAAAAVAAGGETSSGNEKPKKVVKIVKKITKTLEADATVPETPPPGTNEIPVPPKRKVKTIGKSVAAKSDHDP